MKKKSLRNIVVLSALLAAVFAAIAQGNQPLTPGPHDALAAAGVQAENFGQLWNLFVFVCTLVFAAVFIVFLYALWHARRADEQTAPDLSSLGRRETGAYRSVIVAVAVSTVLLIVLLVASVWTDRAMARMSLENAVHLVVTGHQWWWEVRYDGTPESNTFTTANELHVPVGRPVLITLKSDDVIHSLWVPSLAGKKDLIPGRTTLMQFRADQPGLYRGQCAEFCGFQHAFMAFEVIADPPQQYEAWAAHQREEATSPSDPQLQRGEQVFLGSTCVMCHAIQGSGANANFGPDLTHFGGRTTIASGALKNDPSDLKHWISNPQNIKPGTNMPSSTLSDSDLDALVAYLESLK